MAKEPRDRTALITGGDSGIGLAIAQKLFEENINVAVADQAEAKEFPWKYKKSDLSMASQMEELYAWIKLEMGVLDILVLNAGIGIKEKLTEGDPEKWQKVINTNIMGSLRCIRTFVPEMLQRKSGHVVFISSVSANNPHPYGGIYSASKTALDVIAETLRLETLPSLQVTVISPGITDTDFFVNQNGNKQEIQEMCMGAISPAEIAEDVYYALTRKSDRTINQIITRPTGQAF